MRKIHHIINENPTWFSVEDGPSWSKFMTRACMDLQTWALERTERDSTEDIELLQLRRMQKLLTHAATAVPFWSKKLTDCGIKSGKIQSLEDMAFVPETTKSELKAIPLTKRLSQSISKSRYHKLVTSGSIGVPTEVVLDTRTTERHMAIREKGIRRFLGSRREEDRYIKISNRREKYLGYILLDDIDINNPNQVKEKLYALCKKNFCVVSSHPSTIFNLAKEVEEERGVLRLKALIIGGEELQEPVRRYITKVFSCPVITRYSCTEAGGPIALECRKGNYHVNSDQQYIEVIDPQSKKIVMGKEGSILLTDFNNLLMPLIRYNFGDIGRLLPFYACSCGIPYPVIEFVGRANVTVKLPNGKEYLPHRLFGLLSNVNKYPWINQWQVRRVDPTTFFVYLVPNQKVSDQIIQEVGDEIKRRLGENTELKLKLVPRIRIQAGQKMRSYISDV